jgi:aspartyl aminopeptidase
MDKISKTDAISLIDMTDKKLVQGLMQFLQHSPTPYHAVSNMVEVLKRHHYRELDETQDWGRLAAGHYFINRGGSSLIAFYYPAGGFAAEGVRVVGAHTDSPCLRVKPRPELKEAGMLRLGVEIYGGVLLSTWFDRDLSLAGMVSVKTRKGDLQKVAIDFRLPVALLPNLAIHLNRTANENRTINKQTEMPPLICSLQGLKGKGFHDIILAEVQTTGKVADAVEVLGHDLRFYDAQPPALVGLSQEFLASGRLDNLLSCYVGLMSLLNEGKGAPRGKILACYDHEEVGSASDVGALGPLLSSILERLVAGEGHPTTHLAQIMRKSLLFSVDNAHGVHPNYADQHDGNHRPLLNEGVVLKMNANMRYATGFDTGAYLKWLAQKIGVGVQDFVVRADKGCGSTIGPLSTQLLGIPAVDLGVPTFAMHSIRETAGAKDVFSLYQLLSEFFASEKIVY